MQIYTNMIITGYWSFKVRGCHWSEISLSPCCQDDNSMKNILQSAVGLHCSVWKLHCCLLKLYEVASNVDMKGVPF